MDPQSNISPLGSSASFSCSVVAEAVEELLWEVNGGQTSSESYGKTLREKGMEWRYFENDQESNLELTILASEENDETTVVCVAFTLNHGILKTPQVTLSVYGKCMYLGWKTAIAQHELAPVPLHHLLQVSPVLQSF